MCNTVKPWFVKHTCNIKALRVSVQHSISKLTIRGARQLGISYHSVQQILHPDLHLFLFPSWHLWWQECLPIFHSAPHSPSIYSCNFFLWGFLNKKLLTKKMSTLMALRSLIIQPRCTLSEDLHTKVGTNIHLEEVLRQIGESLWTHALDTILRASVLQ